MPQVLFPSRPDPFQLKERVDRAHSNVANPKTPELPPHWSFDESFLRHQYENAQVGVDAAGAVTIDSFAGRAMEVASGC
jgi:hypothetical protein